MISQTEKVMKELLVEKGVPYIQYEDKIRHLAKRIDYSDHVSAIVKCTAIMRCVYAMKKQELPDIVVEDIDYIRAEELYHRIVRDRAFIFGDVLRQLITGEGITRL